MAVVIGRQKSSSLARPYEDENAGSVLNSIINSITSIQPINSKASFQVGVRKPQAPPTKTGVGKVKIVPSVSQSSVSSTPKPVPPPKPVAPSASSSTAPATPIAPKPVIKKKVTTRRGPASKSSLTAAKSPIVKSPSTKSSSVRSPIVKSPTVSQPVEPITAKAYSPRVREPIVPFEIKPVELPQYRTSIPKTDKVVFHEIREDTRLLKFTNNQHDALTKIDNRTDVDVVTKDDVR